MIWKVKPTIEQLSTAYPDKSMVDHVGIEFTEIGDDFISAKMPVDHRTVQPFGLLHGGASCVLAETLGSVGGSLCVEAGRQIVVGLEINANHIRSARSGFVHGTARPVHIGKSTQVWDIKIVNDSNQLVCVSRLTLAVKDI
ncbi:MAG TPA: hotdog fold thioesterase [Chitinophagales bacterium]|nr:hotdog fold thioesterase [Chitinophagales bacterium]